MMRGTEYVARAFMALTFIFVLGSCTSGSQTANSPTASGPTADELTEDFLDGVVGNGKGDRATQIVFPFLARWETPVRVIVFGHSAFDEGEIDKTLKNYADASHLDVRRVQKGETANLIIEFHKGVAAQTPPKEVIAEFREQVRIAMANGIDFTDAVQAVIESENSSKFNATRFAIFRSRFNEALEFNYKRTGSQGVYCTLMRIQPPTTNLIEREKIDTSIIVISDQFPTLLSKEKCTNAGLLRALGFFSTSKCVPDQSL